MADSRKSQPTDQPKAQRKAKAKSDPDAAPKVVVVPGKSAHQLAKERRIADQKVAEARNRALREMGKPTPVEAKRQARREARAKDGVVQSRARRIEAERQRILRKANEDANKKEADERLARAVRNAQHATPALMKVHQG